MSQSSPHCRNQPNAAPPRHISQLQIYEFSAKQPSPHRPPRATARSDCHGSAPHEFARYQKGNAVCAYICKTDEIVGKHYWIWYDFKLWLSRHPGLTIEEALHRFRDEQKTKQRLQGPKFH